MNRREFLKYSSLLPAMVMGKSPISRTLQEVGKYQPEGKPNILILVFDTLSALHTTIAGYQRNTTPNFKRFAERAHVYKSHYAAGNFTSPGTASLLTGTYPWTHRAINVNGTTTGEFTNRNLFRLFDDQYFKIAYTHNPLVNVLLNQFRDGIETWKQTREICLSDTQLADRLFPNDYNAAYQGEWQALRGVKSQSTLIMSFIDRFLTTGIGKILGRQYGELFPRGVPGFYNLRFTLEDMVDWLLADINSFPTPYLAYVHVLPPHAPYLTRREFVDAFKDGWKPPQKEPFLEKATKKSEEEMNSKRRLYDEFLAYADAEFGRLYDGLVANGTIDDTIVILTSDHGELFERGTIGHETPLLYESIVRVPLLMSLPGKKDSKEIESATSCIDLVPTLLKLTDQNIPEWIEGEILPPFTGPDVNDDERSIFVVEAKTNPKNAPIQKGSVAMIKGKYKLIHYLRDEKGSTKNELFNLEDDSDEINNLFSNESSKSEEMLDELKTTLVEKNPPIES